MGEKVYSVPELEGMTHNQLVSKVMHFQAMYRQTLNKFKEEYKKEDKSRLRGKKRNKGSSTIDFKECNYRRIALKFAYLGWDYAGLQAQTNVDNTIEGLLRGAMRHCRLAAMDDPLRFSRCGRTDKGVSAFQQVITARLRTRLLSGPGVTKWVDPYTFPVDDRAAEHMTDFDDETKNVETDLPDDPPTELLVKDETQKLRTEDGAGELCSEESEFDYVAMLNRNLPPEIKVLAWAPVLDEEFSARHNCLGREYRYYFTRGNLNINRMKEAAQLFCGEHDFRNFGKLNVQNTLKFVRTIYEYEIEVQCASAISQPYDMCCARIKGSGFMYHQVRNMMSVLYLIGSGLESSKLITELLDVEKNMRKPTYGLTDPYPLVLYQSKYDHLQWRTSDEARMFLLRHFHGYWNESATKTTIVLELVKSIMNEQCDTSYEVKSLTHDLHSHVSLSGFKHSRKKRPYKKIMDLPLGPTVEEKLGALEAKRKRLGLDDDESQVQVASS